PRVVHGDAPGGEAAVEAAGPRAVALRPGGSGAPIHTVEQICEDTRATPDLVKELRDYGVIAGTSVSGAIVFDDDEREIVRAAVCVSRYGVEGRYLRVMRSWADRVSTLLELLLGPSLRSRSTERRTEAVTALETLASTTMRLKHLLLVRDLRRLIP